MVKIMQNFNYSRNQEMQVAQTNKQKKGENLVCVP